MNKHLIAFFGLMAILFTAEASFGGVMISLSSNPSGAPVILSAGQTITIDVLVSGIDPMDPLDFLGVTTVFDAVSLGAPSSSSFGSIVPDPAYGAATVGSGNALGLYDIYWSASPPLPPGTSINGGGTGSGVFYTFTLTAQNVATTVDSVISIYSADYSTTNGITDPPADKGADINVRVLGSSPVVPEPSSWLVMSVLGIGLAFARKRAKSSV